MSKAVTPTKFRPNKLYFKKTIRQNFTHVHFWELRTYDNRRVVGSSHDQFPTLIDTIRNAVEVFGNGLADEKFIMLPEDLPLRRAISLECQVLGTNGGWS